MKNLIHDKRIETAQCEIAGILKKLETDVNAVVDCIGITDINDSAFDAGPTAQRTVRIQMYAIPGSNWGQAD